MGRSELPSSGMPRTLSALVPAPGCASDCSGRYVNMPPGGSWFGVTPVGGSGAQPTKLPTCTHATQLGAQAP
jgi:hypothetical protein